MQTLLDSEGREPDETGAPEIGLQFELILQPGAAGIRVRPVVPGQNGNWVRTGVSWANLDYYRYGATRTALAAERLLLVKELLALSRLTHRPNLYSYSDDVVRLETISSRRLWDLLGQAGVLGLPLVQPGRKAAPVIVLPAAAEVTVDVTRTESGLRVEPRIAAPDQRVPLERSMLIGSPAHGIAWWDEPTRRRVQREATHPRTRPGGARHAGGRQLARLPPDGRG